MKPNTECESRDVFVWFRDMILYILLRWKSILLVALVVAVLATGFQFWRDTNRYNSIEQAQTPEQEPVTEPLDAEGLAHVAQVQRYQWNYDGLCAYNTTAPMMKIDFQKVPTQQMSYLFTGARSFVAATMCRESLADEMLYAALAEELSTETAAVASAHLAELVTVVLEQDAAESGDSVFVQIRVIAPGKELCESLADVVRDAIRSVTATVQREMGSCRGRWVFDRYGAVRLEEVRDLQLARLADQEQARLDLKEAIDKLTAAEEDYLFVSDREEEKEPTWSYPAPSISLSTLLLGLLGGVLGMVLWYAVRYLYCGRTLSAVEMQVRHGLTTFGTLAGTGKQGVVGRWLRNHLQDAAVEPELLWHRLALVAKNRDVHSLYLVGDARRFEGLSQVMEQQGVSVKIGSSPLANPDTMAALAEAQALILTADLEVTSHKTVAAELELARQLGCEPLGVVLMKK